MALVNPEPEGVWGGLSDDERREVHRHLDTSAKPVPAEHGLTGYRTRGCKCDVCREANRIYQAELRTRRDQTYEA